MNILRPSSTNRNTSLTQEYRAYRYLPIETYGVIIMSTNIFKKLTLPAFVIIWGMGLLMATNAQAVNKLTPRNIPSPIVGVTIDDVDSLSSIVESLDTLSHKPTARIVFDEFVPASRYVEAVDEIHNVSYVMGELLDSFYVKDYSVNAYLERTEEYLNALGSKVDIWEIGNEINGDWLGDTPSVLAKMTGAYDMVNQRGGKTALTLYHDQKSEWMHSWAETHVPERMKQGLDYVFVSFYEDDQNGIKPDWPAVFKRLAIMFPNSKVGFGEVGTKFRSRKTAYLERYYNMEIAQQNFVGGYFWWYFKQDMVPQSKPLWKTLNNAIAPKQISGL